MTTVKQVVPFDLSKMGTEPGMCEKNVRLGYGLPARLHDAKADMEFNRDNGLLHEDMSTLPKIGAVPVFADTPSPNEHIMVAIDGVFYSDGALVTDPEEFKYFGWGESCASFRVVDIVPDPVPEPPVPEPTPEPMPEPEPDNKVYYTYVQGDTFGAVLKKLGLDEGHLWGADGTVKYYTDQLWATQPNVFDANGNIKIGVEFYLIPR